MHRDIKPSNILIRREDEQPVLIDFGAAKWTFAKHSNSLVPYTPGCAAIEQVSEGRLGTWTDIYVIGAVMWRIVAGGNRPYEPPQPVRVERRVNARFRGDPDPMPSARELGRGSFSDRALGAIDQCLELRETDWFQDCRELVKRIPKDREKEPRLLPPKNPNEERKMRPASKVVVAISLEITFILLGISFWLERVNSVEEPKSEATNVERIVSGNSQTVQDQRMAPTSARDELTVERVERLLFSTPKPKHGQSKKL